MSLAVAIRHATSQIKDHFLMRPAPHQADTPAKAEAKAKKPGQAQRMLKPMKKRMIETTKPIIAMADFIKPDYGIRDFFQTSCCIYEI
jgi:hypothetical protein